MPQRVIFLATLLLTGCGPGWHQVRLTPTSELEPRTQYLVHHADSTDRWHALRVSADSVSGIPWLRPIDCDSCRKALPMVEVDSLREGHPVRGFWKGYALAIYGPPLALSVICLFQGHSPACWIPPST